MYNESSNNIGAYALRIFKTLDFSRAIALRIFKTLGLILIGVIVMLVTSDKGIHLIQLHEGVRLKAYKCPAGVWTIGYGHTRTAKPGMVITKEEANILLKQDLKRFEEGVAKLVKVPINQNQIDALVSFAFNVGEGALAKSTLLKKLNNGDTVGAANEFLKWNRAGKRVLAGLTTRRKEERNLFLSEA